MNRLFLDSGAFTVFSANKPKLNLQKYIKFIKKRKDEFEVYANLDVIPEKKQDPNDAAKQSLENYIKMLESMLEPIPVFHRGEKLHWLFKMLERTDYIGFGGMARESNVVKSAWLKETFRYIPKGIKVHGFGIISPDLMHRFPWYSVDSVSWRLLSAYGYVLVPRPVRNYRDPFHIRITDSQDGTRGNSLRYNELGPSERRYIDSYFDDLGLNVKKLGTDRLARDQANIRYFKQAAATAPTKPLLYFGTADGECKALDREREKLRLLSYYNIKDQG